ncbi:MAG: GDYXXLXY domain-containing protein [Knoellia sp.]
MSTAVLVAASIRRRRVLVVGAVVLQLFLVIVAVLSPLSARLTGEEIQLRVAPVDPLDPFRGAYVQLGYPDLPGPTELDSLRGEAWVPLTRTGDVWVGGPVQRTRPGSGLFLRCNDSNWRLACGIDNWFLPQDKAAALEQAVREQSAVANVRVDSRGNAALMGVEVSAGTD